MVWEPARHHQLVVLGRAYQASGDTRFAHEVVAQIESWIDQCPFGRGMHWRSPLELGIRAINWVWAYDLIRDSGAFGDESRTRFVDALNLHAWDTFRKRSRGSSANNHLVGEAAGLFVTGTYFGQLPDAARWRAESGAILECQIREQTYEDGGGREQAFGYHRFVLQFFLVAGIVARRAGTDFSPAYWSRLERMLEFACKMLEGGSAPTFGDDDDGYVLDLGASPGDLRDLLAIGAAIFDRSDFKALAHGHEEAVRWLLGQDGLARYDSLAPSLKGQLGPHAFAHSGYYLLQCGHPDARDRISVLFDCGELGFGSIAAHGHADALSFTIRAFGEDLLVDPGTYDYFTDAEWRQYFRSTRAHNTIEIDDASQSETLGLFLWGRRANARCTHWDADLRRPCVEGEHDGYTRLTDPVTHARRLELDTDARVLTILDTVRASASHKLTLYFHLAEHCVVRSHGPHVLKITTPSGSAILTIDPALEVTHRRGSTDPRSGWVSRGYHRKTEATSIEAKGRIEGESRFISRLTFGRQD